MIRASTLLLTVALAASAGASARMVRPPQRLVDAQDARLWEAPADLSSRDLFNGPWGARLAPNAGDVYTVIRHKHGGVSTGLVVHDSNGRVWHVKQQTRNNRGVEGPVEVVISRVLSAVGYHQPPVYYLPQFRIADGSGSRVESGGRFRPVDPRLHARGPWAWRDNPFVGTRPYNGLLAILLAFNSWDLKDSNNALYDVRDGHRAETWYVVRDLGGALGASGTFSPQRNNIDKFERSRYVAGVHDGFVVFAYHGKRPDLVRNTISVDDFKWAAALLGGLSDRQWQDAFRAGGYDDRLADRFIRKLHENFREAERLVGDVQQASREDR